MGFDGINAVYSVVYEVDQKLGTDYLERFKKWLIRIQDENLMVVGAMTDPKGDRSKGPAVQAPRAQADKYKYQNYMRSQLEQTPNLSIVEAIVSQIITEKDKVQGVRCRDGMIYKAPVVILTTGTFLRGLMHIGTEQFPGGRLGEPAANELSESLQQAGLEHTDSKILPFVRIV